jgi:hypothetical protein
MIRVFIIAVLATSDPLGVDPHPSLANFSFSDVDFVAPSHEAKLDRRGVIAAPTQVFSSRSISDYFCSVLCQWRARSAAAPWNVSHPDLVGQRRERWHGGRCG